MTIKVRLRSRASIPQAEFANAQEQFPAFVAGFGSGKTQAGILRAMRLKLAYPKQDVAYYLPTYDLVQMIGYPRFEETLDRAKLLHKLNESKHVIKIKGKGRIIFRTMENPARIVGYEVADSIVDELDTLKQTVAEAAWRAIIARNRQKKPDRSLNTVAVATTPEGFRFVYNTWAKDPAEGYRLIRASTYSNERNLPAGYIDSLKRSYPPQLIEAYLEGKFVNLTSGAVYPDFCRVKNHTDATLDPGELVHVGVDFNVYNCTGIICVIRGGKPIVVGELTGVRDTPALAAMLRDRYKAQGHHVSVYPDASGQGHKTVNASLSDLQILKDHGLTVLARSTNPAVRDRVAGLCALICNGEGVRTLLVNTKACPVLTEALEQQIYDKHGDPDKDAGKDHPPDGLGYFIHYRWPIVKPVSTHSVPLVHMDR